MHCTEHIHLFETKHDTPPHFADKPIWHIYTTHSHIYKSSPATDSQVYALKQDFSWCLNTLARSKTFNSVFFFSFSFFLLYSSFPLHQQPPKKTIACHLNLWRMSARWCLQAAMLSCVVAICVCVCLALLLLSLVCVYSVVCLCVTSKKAPILFHSTLPYSCHQHFRRWLFRTLFVALILKLLHTTQHTHTPFIYLDILHFMQSKCSLAWLN